MRELSRATQPSYRAQAGDPVFQSCCDQSRGRSVPDTRARGVGRQEQRARCFATRLRHDLLWRCRNGYRFAKWQGKPNFASERKPAWDRHFCHSAADGAGNAFTFDSSRYLNCPSNLIGHDHPNQPAKRRGDDLSTSGRAALGQGGEK
jgi:hypothetical protein